jgi:hypothetical protein
VRERSAILLAPASTTGDFKELPKTLRGQMQAHFKQEELRSKDNYAAEFIKYTLNDPHNTVMISKNEPRENDAMEAKLRLMQSVIEEAKAAAALNQDEECPFYDEKGLYSIRDSARNTFGIASVQDMPNLIAVNMLAADLARNLTANIFRSDIKAWLLTKFLCVMGYVSDGNDRQSAESSIGQLHLRPTMSALGQPELLSNLLGDRMMTLLELYKQIACDLVYSDDPRKRGDVLKRNDAPTITCWAHLWNQFVKDTFAVFRLQDKQSKVSIHNVRVNFQYTLDPLMMGLLQAQFGYAYEPPDETYAAAFVERKMEQLRKAAAASQIKNEKKEKKRILPLESNGEVSYDDYQAALRDEGLAGDFRARPSQQDRVMSDAIVSRPSCKQVRPFWEHDSFTYSFSMCGGYLLA